MACKFSLTCASNLRCWWPCFLFRECDAALFRLRSGSSCGDWDLQKAFPPPQVQHPALRSKICEAWSSSSGLYRILIIARCTRCPTD